MLHTFQNKSVILVVNLNSVFCNADRGALPLPLGEVEPTKSKAVDTSAKSDGSSAASKQPEISAAAAPAEPLPTTRRAVMAELSKLMSHKDNKVLGIRTAMP